MVGRAVIDHPWIFREASARLGGMPVVPPTDDERRAMFRTLIENSVAARGERVGVDAAKRFVGVLGPLAPRLRHRLVRAHHLADALEALAS